MDTEFNDVTKFHLKFRQLVCVGPAFLSRRKAAERANFMLEELIEYAHSAGLSLMFNGNGDPKFKPDAGRSVDIEDQADALIDIVYVAKGTGVMMGLPWKELWDDVQRANMAKELGATPRSIANPGQFLMDVGKPPGWVPPKGYEILVRNGYREDAFMTEDGMAFDESKFLDDAIYSKGK